MSHTFPKSRDIAVSDLYFDPENPRFAALSFDKSNENEVIKYMLSEQSLIDLIVSIAEQDFFPGEPLLVYQNSDGKMIVVEGNRRLSALKILQNPELSSLPSIQAIVNEQSTHRPSRVPCLEFCCREDILGYLGFKHITGTKSWGSLEKAIYLNQLKSLLLEQRPELSGNNDEIHKILARQIGSKAPTVGKTLAAYYIYEKGKDEKGTFFDIQGLDQKQVDFSLIYTALTSPSVYKYVGLESASDVDQRNFNYAHGKDLFIWLFREDAHGKTPVLDSRQIPILARVLENQKSIEIFKKTLDLQLAYRLSGGYISAFEQTIILVEKNARELSELITKIRRNADEHGDATPFMRVHANNLEQIGEDFIKMSRDITRILLADKQQ